MQTTVFLIHHGETDWYKSGRVLGTADIALNQTGLAQSKALCDALAGLEIAEILTSPLLRAVQTAELIANAAGLEITRDPRLVDFPAGSWTGKYYRDLAEDPSYRRFLAEPLAERTPGGERLLDVEERAAASLQQALADNSGEQPVLLVTHANVIAILLVHYLAASSTSYLRMQIEPGSVSLLRFSTAQESPRVLGVNLQPGKTLADWVRA